MGRRWQQIETCNEISEGSGARQLDWVEVWEQKPWAWYDRFGWLPNQGSEHGNSTKNARLQTICDAAKAQDITMFSVGFEVTSRVGHRDAQLRLLLGALLQRERAQPDVGLRRDRA